MQMFKILGLLALAAVLTLVGMAVFQMSPKMESILPQTVITNFEECVAAGNPVMESYPRQCMTGDGRSFVEDVPPVGDPNQTSNEGIVFNGCVVAGCSGQLCVSADEAGTIVTDCAYRAEYACYREASCEPQTNGQCGWTETPELQRCLANPPMLEGEMQLEVM